MEDQNIQRDVENWFMNILVIGNGFDLAHGLPTRLYGASDVPIIRYNGNNLELLCQEMQKGMQNRV